nr:TetR/AcrR family transcriptional regulator [Polymorphobacter sp.]
MNQDSADRRIERSRRAILEAFRSLFFERGYGGVDVCEVAARANVGRSTLYKHFRNKEDLLVQSLRPFLALLTDACISDRQPDGLSYIPEHFWEKRRFARAVFSGRSMSLIVATLAEAIEQRLTVMPGAGPSLLPVRLVAAQLAASQMTLLDEWLRGRGAATTAQITVALHRSSRALVRELMPYGSVDGFIREN